MDTVPLPLSQPARDDTGDGVLGVRTLAATGEMVEKRSIVGKKHRGEWQSKERNLQSSPFPKLTPEQRERIKARRADQGAYEGTAEDSSISYHSFHNLINPLR